MKAELRIAHGNIRVTIGNITDDGFYSFELHDSGIIVGGSFCLTTETTITDVRERLMTLFPPEKMC